VPRDNSIKKVLVIGSGPIVIGQACEFDYSGAQACKVLMEEGIKVVLINSNPATIMTDPDMADRTYIEPITPEMVEKVIIEERPDAVLPTLGGQTALNTALTLAENGVFEKYGVRMIGADRETIERAENREQFKAIVEKAGLGVAKSFIAHNMDDAVKARDEVGFPAIIRPSFTLGGSGGNIAYNNDEYERFVEWGLSLSPMSEVLIEESILGWKEYELEVMRDKADNVVIVCPIENLDPMGIHTGDSVTVAPAQTLTDKEYQVLRDASIDIMRLVGVETGGSNVQFAVCPKTGRVIVIEMNPRVSRSSALASKATGFPIAKIATKLAIGYTLDEIPNDITRKTYACFEPSIDYCVVKWPRFTFEKFPNTDPTLGIQMRSVGEAMSIGRTFKEAFNKAIRSLEIGRDSLSNQYIDANITDVDLMEKLRQHLWDRLWYVAEALRRGISVAKIYQLSAIDPWYLHNLREIVQMEAELIKNIDNIDVDLMRKAKQYGFADSYLAKLANMTESDFRAKRKSMGIIASFKRVDTCAGEFEAFTPYLYSSYDQECEAERTDRRKIMILGGGPNRIGQGIEFDYCCVHASFAMEEIDVESIMVNCNPETVSTDYDTSDKLYFEPLAFEDVMSIIDKEKPDGVIVQFGGQTPLKLAQALEEAGVTIIGTSPDSIDRAEDRERFRLLLNKLELQQPYSGTTMDFAGALSMAKKIGYPVLVRPSFVLGGRAMNVVYDDANLERCVAQAIEASPDHPVLIDKFLAGATELDVDAVCDGHEVVIGGVLEHIEEAGIHSGDSACSLPPVTLSDDILKEVKRQTKLLAMELKVLGLINIQYAVLDGEVYIIEVNPRASRTVPFVSKVIGVPLAKIAAKIMAGKTLKELNFTKEVIPKHIAVKEAVFPFIKFPGVDTTLGPEMLSTGEVMGLSTDFGIAFAKSQIAAGSKLPPEKGTVFISIKDLDKKSAMEVAMPLHKMGYKLVATGGTCDAIRGIGVPVDYVKKVADGRPNVVDKIINGDIDFVINTTVGAKAIKDSFSIRRSALDNGVPYVTTFEAAKAMVKAMQSLQTQGMSVKPLQLYNRSSK